MKENLDYCESETFLLTLIRLNKRIPFQQPPILGALRGEHLLSGNGQQIGGYDRSENIALERTPSFPIAPSKTKTAFEPADARFDTGSKTSELFVHILTAAHVGLGEAAFFGKTNIFDMPFFSLEQIILGGKPTVEGDFQWVPAIDVILAIKHLFHKRCVCGVSFKDFAIKNEIIWLTAKQVAKLMQCSRERVYELAKSGQISYIKAGKNVRFKPEDLDEYEKQSYVKRSYYGTLQKTKQL